MEEAREQDFLQVPNSETPMNVELNEDPWTPMTAKRRHSNAGMCHHNYATTIMTFITIIITTGKIPPTSFYISWCHYLHYHYPPESTIIITTIIHHC
jgi:hypothetical protein